MTELRVICTDRGQHGSIELAVIWWHPPDDGGDGFAVWDDSSIRGLESSALGDSARGTKSSAANRQVHRTPVEVRIRADGGKTYVMPRCPKCGKTVLLRDDRLSAYVEKSRDTPSEAAYDVSLKR